MATKWTVIEHFDRESGELVAHIMPIVEVDGFPSKQAAWDFLHGLESKSLDPDDLPCLTDDEDHIVATYIGHTLKKSCPCEPTSKDGALVHHLAN